MRPRALHCAALVLASLAALPAARSEAEDAAANLTLRKTYLKTQAGSAVLVPIWADAFSPTTIACPDDPGSCAVRVEVSSVFEQIEPGSVAMVRTRVDGASPLPTTAIEVDSTSTGTLSNARTFTWMKTGVAAGNHVVDVEFGMAGLGEPALAGQRTLTIEVYKAPFVVAPAP